MISILASIVRFVLTDLTEAESNVQAFSFVLLGRNLLNILWTYVIHLS